MTSAVAENIEASAEVDGTESLDIAAFQEAANDVSVDDAANPRSDSVRAVRAAFTNLDRKGRSAAKKWLSEEGTNAVMAEDLSRAKVFSLLKTTGVKIAAPAGPRAESNRKTDAERLVEQIATIQVAYSLATDLATSTGVDWQNQVVVTDQDVAEAKAYSQYIVGGLEGPEPEVSDLAKAGARVSLGRGPKGQGRKPRKADVAVAAGE